MERRAWSRSVGCSVRMGIGVLWVLAACGTEGDLVFNDESSPGTLEQRSVAGGITWTRQVGTSADDYGWAAAVDGSGNVYVAGVTSGAFAFTNQGGRDAIVAKYDPSGSFIWSRQLGAALDQWGRGVAVDSSGNVYLAGWTQSSLNGTAVGLSALIAC